MVVPDDEDRFFTTESEAARACKQVERSREWSKQWNDFLVHINRWCDAHRSDIEAGYVTVGDSALNVLLCLHTPDYDFGLEDRLRQKHPSVWKLYQPLYSYSRLARYWCMRVKPDDVPYIVRRLNKVERAIQGGSKKST